MNTYSIDVEERIKEIEYKIKRLHPLAAVTASEKLEEEISKKKLEIGNYFFSELLEALDMLKKGWKIKEEDLWNLWDAVRGFFLHYDYVKEFKEDIKISCAPVLTRLPIEEQFNKILVLLWFIGNKNELIAAHYFYLKNMESLMNLGENIDKNKKIVALIILLNTIVNKGRMPSYSDVYSNKFVLDTLAYIKAVLKVYCPWLYTEYRKENRKTNDSYEDSVISQIKNKAINDLKIKNKLINDLNELENGINEYIEDSRKYIEDLKKGTKLREIFNEKIDNLEKELNELEEKFNNYIKNCSDIELLERLFKIYYRIAFIRHILLLLIEDREWVKEKVNKIIKKLQEYGSLDEEDLAFLYSERLNILDDDIYSKVVGLIIFYRRLKELGISFPYYKTSFDDLRDKIKEMAKDENQKRELSRLVGQIRALKKGKDKWDIEELRRLLDRLSKLGSVIEEFVKPEVIICY